MLQLHLIYSNKLRFCDRRFNLITRLKVWVPVLKFEEFQDDGWFNFQNLTCLQFKWHDFLLLVQLKIQFPELLLPMHLNNPAHIFLFPVELLLLSVVHAVSSPQPFTVLPLVFFKLTSPQQVLIQAQSFPLSVFPSPSNHSTKHFLTFSFLFARPIPFVFLVPILLFHSFLRL